MNLNYFYEKAKKHYSTIAFVSGFIFDNLTLGRIDLWLDNLILLLYLVLAGLAIILIHLFSQKEGMFARKVYPWTPLALQFFFGALFSSYFVFYSRSASFSSSWPFMLFLGFLLVGNEFFEKKYTKFAFQTSIYYITVLSYVIFLVPIFLGKMGASVFLLSGALSLAAIALFISVLSSFAKDKTAEERKGVFVSIVSIYFVFNVMYFGNLIPPIPLSLKDIGIYHYVEKTANGGYSALAEPKEKFLFVFNGRSDSTMELRRGEALYCFSSVFAPTRLNTEVFHEWQYYDEGEGRWVPSTRISFSVSGGRDGGYRGFSFKSALFGGKWRCSVETERGQVIGRREFYIKTAEGPLNLETVRL